MTFKLLTFVTLILSMVACTRENPEDDYSNSSVLAFNLMNVCVDKTLNTHSELNTKNYVLDLSEISTLNREGIDSFFKIRNPVSSSTHEDSVFVLGNKSWNRSRLLENIIVKFIEVEYIDKKYVSVKLSKMRSANQTIKITLDLERENDSYKIIKSEIKR